MDGWIVGSATGLYVQMTDAKIDTRMEKHRQENSQIETDAKRWIAQNKARKKQTGQVKCIARAHDIAGPPGCCLK
eukprot:8833973-Karenia_brevis.AAC.1